MTVDIVIGVFIWLLGLCVGSFLNVVVYRLPVGLSISKPRRSFCPRCNQPIAWHDNIPVLSWLLLRARCRRCGGSISVQYPLVEALTGLSFVLIYYLLFVEPARVGVSQPAHPHDWPLLAAWLVLAATLIACAAMDVVSYMVDVRVTYVAVIAGLVLHAAWPRDDYLVPQAATPLAAAAVVTLLASAMMLWLTVWRVVEDEPEDDEAEKPESASTPASPAAVTGGRLAIAAFVGLTLWLLVATALHGHQPRNLAVLALSDSIEPYDAVRARLGRGRPSNPAVPATLLTIFAVTALVGGQRREADQEVSAAIQEEQPQARKLALRELGWLAAPVIAGLAAYGLVAFVPPVATGWTVAVGWSPGGGFCPLGGAAFAALGAMAGAAAGWVLRIVFTLVFGKEALGIGDIYILAGAGAAAGWDIALLGLLLSVGVAIAGYVFSLLLKRSVIIPFGPWLALGFVAALWLNHPAAEIAGQYRADIAAAWTQRPDICLMASGLMLIGSAVAIVLARLVRRLVEPADK